MAAELPPEIMAFEAEVQQIFKDLNNPARYRRRNEGFQRLDKIKDLEKQRKQLEELTGKMRGVKRWGTKKIFSVKIVGRISYMLSSSYSDGFIYRILKDFDQGIKDDPTNLELNKTVAEKKKSLIRELNTYIALRKTFSSTISSKAELFEGGSQAGTATNQAYRVASTMSNQELLQVGRKQMDEMDKSIERSKRVVEDTLHIGTETAVTLKAQVYNDVNSS
uniref:t-SNARE coiled-coil homology domain-containing protein n=1 Tax=Physcomitrium patens TaxID=3218 RepID=A0A2K1L9I6_PHYPA|nr:hypothetical protein PHYPA_001120 [Physcomitrium patens]